VYIPQTHTPWISAGTDTWDYFLKQLSLYADAFMAGSTRFLGDLNHDAIYFFYRDGTYNDESLKQSLAEWKVPKKAEWAERYPLFSQMIEQDIDGITSRVQSISLSEPTRPKSTILQKLAGLLHAR
jgi:hypothetical protein